MPTQIIAHAIVDGLVGRYGPDTNRRATDEGEGVAMTFDDGGNLVCICDVYRRLIDPVAVSEIACSIDEVRADMDEPGFQELFLPQYRGFNSEFWMALQNIHDDKQFWHPSRGMTTKGKQAIRVLKWQIENNFNTFIAVHDTNGHSAEVVEKAPQHSEAAYAKAA